MLLQIGSHPIVWYCNRLSPDNPHVRGLQLYYWLCSMSVILILRALGTFDKILWDENSLLPHHPCAWNLQRFWIWSPSFHCRKKPSKTFQDPRYELRRCVRTCTRAMCGRKCACACKKTFKTCVRSVCARTFLTWSHTTHVRPHILPTFQAKKRDFPDFATK